MLCTRLPRTDDDEPSKSPRRLVSYISSLRFSRSKNYAEDVDPPTSSLRDSTRTPLSTSPFPTGVSVATMQVVVDTRDSFDIPPPSRPMSHSLKSNDGDSENDGPSLGRQHSHRNSKYSGRRSFASSRALLAKVPGMRISGALERPLFVHTTDEMVRLDTIIQSEKGRQVLINRAIALPGSTTVKIRFCHAVEQYDSQAEDGTNSAGKERKLGQAVTICDMFLRERSAFFLSELTEARRDFILEGNYAHLIEAKREILAELTKSNELMNIVDYVEGLEGV